MPQLIVVADDLTGASDTGIAFAKAGLKTIVSIQNPDSTTNMAVPVCDVFVISTHSRHLSADEAYAQVLNALSPFQHHSDELPWIYKKIDSTLRGHPGPELRATVDAFALDESSIRHVLIAPAFPAQGRTTLHGQQLVNGVPVAETSFGQEVPNSDVGSFFTQLSTSHRLQHLELGIVRADSGPSLVELFNAPKPTLFVSDAVNDADLQALADAAVASKVRLFCGSAGLANALTRSINLQPAEVASPQNVSARNGPVVIIAGSYHKQTARQIDAMMACANDELLDFSAVHLQPQSISRSASQATSQATDHSLNQRDLDHGLRALKGGSHLAISTVGLVLDGLGGQLIANRLGAFARRILERTRLEGIEIGGVVLTGGDTAMATCWALESSALRLRGEVELGVPYGELIDGPYAGLRLVTKAGGFGSEQVFTKAIECLQQESVG